MVNVLIMIKTFKILRVCLKMITIKTFLFEILLLITFLLEVKHFYCLMFKYKVKKKYFNNILYNKLL